MNCSPTFECPNSVQVSCSSWCLLWRLGHGTCRLLQLWINFSEVTPGSLSPFHRSAQAQCDGSAVSSDSAAHLPSGPWLSVSCCAFHLQRCYFLKVVANKSRALRNINLHNSGLQQHLVFHPSPHLLLDNISHADCGSVAGVKYSQRLIFLWLNTRFLISRGSCKQLFVRLTEDARDSREPGGKVCISSSQQFYSPFLHSFYIVVNDVI